MDRLLFCLSLVSLSSCSALPLLVGLPPPPLSPGARLAEPQWVEQKLDHFSESDTRTWQQRYFVNSSLWKRDSGPVFLMLGGEGPANPAWIATDTDMMRNAARFGALVFFLEHRFLFHSLATHTHTHSLATHSLTNSHTHQVLRGEPPHARCLSLQPDLPLQQTGSERCRQLQAEDGGPVLSD